MLAKVEARNKKAEEELAGQAGQQQLMHDVPRRGLELLSGQARRVHRSERTQTSTCTHISRMMMIIKGGCSQCSAGNE